jgi:hypothetical protein
MNLDDVDKSIQRVKITEYLLSINDVLVVETLDSQENVGCVEQCCLFSESSQMGQVEKELTTTAVVKHEVQLFAILKSIFQFYDVRVLDKLKNSALCHGPFNLIFLADLFFFQNFHGI